MRAHGGELALVSSTAIGTVFRLTLPAPALDIGRNAAELSISPAGEPVRRRE
jgi:hypothetical protein